MIRYGLIGLGVGVACVAVYRYAKRRGVEPETVARQAARKLQRGARDIANQAASAAHRSTSAQPRKHRNRVRSSVR